MNISWGSDISNRFITNVGLVTTNGIYGHNIMACEWTYHLSYHPALIGVSVNKRHATHVHIKANKEFGVCFASTHQAMLTSIAGRESGKIYDKIKVAETMGFKFSPAKNIDVVMPDGVAVTLECKLSDEIILGDHTLFVGEVIDGSVNPDEKPLAYHWGRYWEMVATLEKPSNESREKIKELITRHPKLI
jgi:flavin reductase (DIM6/NTAB) family NADH-FMN oxidoreductase RutF